MAVDFTLADLTRLTAAKRRTVQLWAEASVIQAVPDTERAGSGTHRRFSRTEAINACLVHAFSLQFQAPIGVLLQVSRLLRTALEDHQFRSMMEKAIHNEARIYLLLRGSGAPKFLISYGDGTRDTEASIICIDASDFEDDQDGLLREIGLHTVETLGQFGAATHTILANPHLRELA